MVKYHFKHFHEVITRAFVDLNKLLSSSLDVVKEQVESAPAPFLGASGSLWIVAHGPHENFWLANNR